MVSKKLSQGNKSLNPGHEVLSAILHFNKP